jgi:hypothetical protein
MVTSFTVCNLLCNVMTCNNYRTSYQLSFTFNSEAYPNRNHRSLHCYVLFITQRLGCPVVIWFRGRPAGNITVIFALPWKRVPLCLIGRLSRFPDSSSRLSCRSMYGDDISRSLGSTRVVSYFVSLPMIA